MKRKTDWRLLAQIFWSFLKIGPVTFGGGYAMIPHFQREVVEQRGWLAEREVTDVLAIAQSTPGAIGVNSAVFVGYKIAGVRGALTALGGVLLPTFLIVIGMCAAFLEIRDNPKIEAAFQGIRPAIVALIVYAGWRTARTSVKDKTTFCVGAAALAMLIATNMNPVFIILFGILSGVLLVAAQIRWLGRQPDDAEEEHLYEDYFIGDGI